MAKGWNDERSYQWEHTRHICYFIAASVRDPKKSMLPITKWMPLPTDEEPSKDDLMSERAKLIESINKLYGKQLTA